MQKHSLNDLVEFNPNRFNPKVLINEPGHRMVLMNMLAGQSIPEHAAAGTVTIYGVRGHVSFYENGVACDLRSGEVLTIDAGAKHKVEAHEDSVLLVLATGGKPLNELPVDVSEELDIREVPRPLRHPMIFAKFDALVVGASVRLLNDHDPIPLNRQFDMLRPGQAKWDYIERGSGIFRIRITRIAPASASDVAVVAAPQQTQIEPSRL